MMEFVSWDYEIANIWKIRVTAGRACAGRSICTGWSSAGLLFLFTGKDGDAMETRLR